MVEWSTRPSLLVQISPKRPLLERIIVYFATVLILFKRLSMSALKHIKSRSKWIQKHTAVFVMVLHLK
jgi:hypothetical protein